MHAGTRDTLLSESPRSTARHGTNRIHDHNFKRDNLKDGKSEEWSML